MDKYFISYSRSVRVEINRIIELLRATGHEVWWDADISAGQAWWATIVDKIEWCKVFIFVVSERSVQSPYCLSEAKYARDRNRPILPLIIDDNSHYAIPAVVTPKFNQWLNYKGDPEETVREIVLASTKLTLNPQTDMHAPRPPEPGKEHTSLARQFHQGVTLAENGHFDEAIKQFWEIESLDHARWGLQCREWIGKIVTYREIADLADHKSTHRMARTEWSKYIEIYTDEDGLFDPFDVMLKIKPISQVELDVQAPESPQTPKLDSMPKPFAWVNIPAGRVMLAEGGYVPEEGQSFDVPSFTIGRYPITNAQYAKFIEARGYHERRWWTEAGWETAQKKQWTEPRYWQDGKWNGAKHPVVGVSWYEAVAFCLWLSEAMGKNIMLPSEQQWQRAAQGNKGFVYPWGNEWDATRCNNAELGPHQTTPVDLYEGRGDSQHGVVDMSGNVCEWCITNYVDGGQEIDSNVGRRVLRGGSWYVNLADTFRTDYRFTNYPNLRLYNWGFRLAHL